MTAFITAFFENVGELFNPASGEGNAATAAAIVSILAVPVTAVVCRKAASIFKRFTNG